MTVVADSTDLIVTDSGDVLALASAPVFNPNAFVPRINPSEWLRLSDETLKPQINRAMQENYAPGSVFKVVTGLAALESGLDPKRRFYNPGYIFVPGRRSPAPWRWRAG